MCSNFFRKHLPKIGLHYKGEFEGLTIIILFSLKSELKCSHLLYSTACNGACQVPYLASFIPHPCSDCSQFWLMTACLLLQPENYPHSHNHTIVYRQSTPPYFFLLLFWYHECAPSPMFYVCMCKMCAVVDCETAMETQNDHLLIPFWYQNNREPSNLHHFPRV